MFDWSLEKKRQMKRAEDVEKEGPGRGHFSICLLSLKVNLTVRLKDKDKL